MNTVTAFAKRLRCCLIALFATLSLGVVATPTTSYAAGFEVGENTPRSVARGGTGVVNTADPSAVYFNPALLGFARDNQLMITSNVLDLNVEFQRDDFYSEPGGDPDQTFGPVNNESGLFPAPFVAASFDLGPDEFSLGAGLFGPPAYGNPCYGEIEDGECQLDREHPMRGMAVETDMVVVYPSVGAAYQFDLGDDRRLDVGLTAMLAYQNTDFTVVADTDTSPPWRENPDDEVFVQGRNLSGIAPTGVLGISFEDGPLRLGASYRPPIRWNLTGTADVGYPPAVEPLNPEMTDDTMHLETWHAGSLRLGWGLQWGEHPADSERPRWDLEFNTIWENWSVVDNFRIELDGNITPAGGSEDDALTNFQPVYQRKGYQDTISLRTGLSYGVNSWLTAHGGGFLETAAQPIAYTSADFISWERYSAGGGASIHLPYNLELDLGYSFIYSPSRTVEQGEVYNPIPMSSCTGPDFQDDACEQSGTPPGNPQNEGQWSAHFHIFSAGVAWRY